MGKTYKISEVVDFVSLIDREPSLEDRGNAHWAVCRAYSSRVHIVRSEIEKTSRGTFLPTYARVWCVDGKQHSKERVLMPGYLFFMADEEGWGEVSSVYGVFDVLSNDGKASRVTDAEMQRLLLDHATGRHNRIEAVASGPQKARYGRRRRRPRPGRQFREKARAA